MKETDPKSANSGRHVGDDLEGLAEVKAFAGLTGLDLTDERAKIVAAAIEVWRPLLECLDEFDLGDIRPSAIFDACWDSLDVDS